MKPFARYAFVVVLGIASSAALAATTPAVLYPMPHCSCCGKYATYLGQRGFSVREKDPASPKTLEKIATRDGVPLKYREQPSGMHTGICHITLVGGYVVVGHVPASVIHRLLRQQPKDITGIILPGMPMGSPGMTGKKSGPFVIYAFNASGKTWVYAKV